MRVFFKLSLFFCAVVFATITNAAGISESTSGDSVRDCRAKLNAIISGEWANSYCLVGSTHCEVSYSGVPGGLQIDLIPDVEGVRGFRGLYGCGYPFQISIEKISIPSGVMGSDGVVTLPTDQPFAVNFTVKSQTLDSEMPGFFNVIMSAQKGNPNKVLFFESAKIPFSSLQNTQTFSYTITIPSTDAGNGVVGAGVEFSNDINENLHHTSLFFKASGSAPVKPDVSVSSVDFAQVVFNPQSIAAGIFENQWGPLVVPPSTSFTAVAEKSSSFRPTVSLSNAGTTVLSGMYRVQILSGTTVISQSTQLDYSTLSSGSYTVSPDLMAAPSPLPSFVPKVLGANALKAVVVNSDARVQSVEKNLTLNVVKTYNPVIGLARLASGDTSRYSSTSDTSFSKFMQLSSYLSSVLPVADKSINLISIGTVAGNSFSGGAVTNDLQALTLKRRLMQLNRSALIVNQNYFKFIGEEDDIIGLHIGGPLNKEMIVSEDYLSVLPHELSHSFGVHYEMYKSKIPNRLFNGYNADPTSYPGTIKLFSSMRSFMDAARSSDSITDMPWIDERSYSIIFDFLQKPIVDPKTILISGSLSKSGEIQNLKTYDIPNGVLTESSLDGDLQFKTFDINGNNLSSVSVKSDFKLYVQGNEFYTGPSEVDADVMPFAIEVPYDEKVASVQVLRNGQEISKSNLQALKVVAIIERMPLAEFKAIGCTRPKDKMKFAQNEKDVLLRIAEATQRVLNSKSPDSAKILLEALIVSVKLTTSSTFIPNEVDELSQADVISGLKAIIKSLDNVKTPPKGR